MTLIRTAMIYNNYGKGVNGAIEIIKLFIESEGRPEYYLNLTPAMDILKEVMKDGDPGDPFFMAYDILNHNFLRRDENGELVHAIEIEFKNEKLVAALKKLKEALEKMKKNPRRAPWIEKIMAEIDLFLDEFGGVDKNLSLGLLKSGVGNLSNPVDVRKWWDEGAKSSLTDYKNRLSGTRRARISEAIIRIESTIEDLVNKYYLGGNVPKSVGSPIEAPHKTGELVFWDGKIQGKRTLEYIRGDQLLLEEDRLKAIKNNKPQAYPNVMEAIKERNKKLVSNIRFAFSGNVLEGSLLS